MLGRACSDGEGGRRRRINFKRVSCASTTAAAPRGGSCSGTETACATTPSSGSGGNSRPVGRGRWRRAQAAISASRWIQRRRCARACPTAPWRCPSEVNVPLAKLRPELLHQSAPDARFFHQPPLRSQPALVLRVLLRSLPLALRSGTGPFQLPLLLQALPLKPDFPYLQQVPQLPLHIRGLQQRLRQLQQRRDGGVLASSGGGFCDGFKDRGQLRFPREGRTSCCSSCLRRCGSSCSCGRG